LITTLACHFLQYNYEVQLAENSDPNISLQIKLVDGLPTDNSAAGTAGFRLPAGGEAEAEAEQKRPRIIEVLVAEEEEDLVSIL
jgi:hypothetical protein